MLNDTASVLVMYLLMAYMAVIRQNEKLTIGIIMIVLLCLLLGFHISNIFYRQVLALIAKREKKKRDTSQKQQQITEYR